jgi:D-glycero-D-manno-heptose 1,7-bisphosphate phosphatase
VARLTQAGYRILLISNQAGIARGCMTVKDVEAIHRNMCSEIEAAGGLINAIYYCPHHWDDGCRCRKPDIGMFLQASRDFHVDVSRAIFIGDDERDGFAAENAGCGFIRIDETTSLWDAVTQIIG